LIIQNRSATLNSMSMKLFSFAALVVVACCASSPDSAETCKEDTPTQAQALLQAHRAISYHDGKLLEKTSAVVGTNPSGAAASLDEAGYSAVADRCCLSEMRQFIERQAKNLNLDICNDGGLNGLVPFHTCLKGPKTFAELTSTLLSESSQKCSWVASAGTCNKLPDEEAELNQAGYAAVVDRCCQAEVKHFITRTAKNLNLEICDPGGVTGLAPFHHCEKEPQTFADLTSTLLAASTQKCYWLTKGKCEPLPADCQGFVGGGEGEGGYSSDCTCHMSKTAKFDFSIATVTNNNLGGKGPGSGPEELRYGNVGTSDKGEAFDLVVTTLGAYGRNSNGKDENGIKGAFGKINMNHGSSTDFRFNFMLPGTTTPLMLSEVHMAVFDIDGGDGKGVESASSKGYAGYVTDSKPSIVASRLPDGRTKFTSGGLTANVPNPSDPETLDQAMRKASVMFFYVNVTGFDLTFSIDGGTWDRNLFFAGVSSLNDQCEK